ncbi:branched-chain amino acid ABC transporter permease [Candidatus Raskinella chloraquaticus]|uniref:Branched-chain amino acid ABC transporter n=1 Tax=Candidatus Raskinella chloraquaticus TaxID=1951219 RepID=A0A1W9I5E0_9HYPH|nr:MAG: branched-chain amino acid ABC transporter [Proteobacteria bacterium SG_bin8]
MSLTLSASVIVQGVLTGLVYGLMALGLSVIFGIVRVVNFAHGEFAVLAMYIAYLLFFWLKLDPFLAALPIAALFFGVGYLLQRALINSFVARAEHDQFILMVGLAIVLVNGCLMIFGPEARHAELSYSLDSWLAGPLIIDAVRVYAAIGSLVVALMLLAFFRLTDTGTAIRACADNRLAAAIVGLDTRRLYALTFGLGLACVGAAGAMQTAIIDPNPSLAPGMTLLAFTVVIVGGLGSLIGALFAGILIGVAEALSSLVMAPSMKSLASFAVLVLVLVLRPQGLFGKGG